MLGKFFKFVRRDSDGNGSLGLIFILIVTGIGHISAELSGFISDIRNRFAGIFRLKSHVDSVDNFFAGVSNITRVKDDSITVRSSSGCSC